MPDMKNQGNYLPLETFGQYLRVGYFFCVPIGIKGSVHNSAINLALHAYSE